MTTTKKTTKPRYLVRKVGRARGDTPAWAVFDTKENQDAEGRDGPLRFDREEDARAACRTLATLDDERRVRAAE